MLDNNINTYNAKQAITHYSCDECVKKQIKHNIINITGKAIEHNGMITRKFVNNLF